MFIIHVHSFEKKLKENEEKRLMKIKKVEDEIYAAKEFKARPAPKNSMTSDHAAPPVTAPQIPRRPPSIIIEATPKVAAPPKINIEENWSSGFNPEAKKPSVSSGSSSAEPLKKEVTSQPIPCKIPAVVALPPSANSTVNARTGTGTSAAAGTNISTAPVKKASSTDKARRKPRGQMNRGGEIDYSDLEFTLDEGFNDLVKFG
jgi:hypothetical protein